jgi:putative GTP pyrophosphokinase
MSEVILKEFDAKSNLYSVLTRKMELLIQEILSARGIGYHSITSRTKDKGSLSRKLTKKGESYSCLADITDISGVRITTYFEDDVDHVIKILEQEFEVDIKNSVDKRNLLDPDRFGYLSTHHVVTLTANRAALPEYQRVKDLKVEIQTRSILQHAWAEIEHDLGYKSKSEVPREIRRKFSRLAGLLELADIEFTDIKNQLANYNNEVEEKIRIEPQLVELDRDSLIAFVKNNILVKEIDNAIATSVKSRLYQSNDLIASLIDNLLFLKISTIASLKNALSENKELIIAFAIKWFSDNDDEYEDTSEIYIGISIFYLCYVLLAKTQSKNLINEYGKMFALSNIDNSPLDLGKEVLECFAAIKK